MHLTEATLQGFQSYREAQMVHLDRSLTLLAGRNDVGKSALLRALRMFVEPQEGLRTDFRLTLSWEIGLDELLFRIIPAGADIPELAQWLGQHELHRVSATFVANGIATPMPVENLFAREIQFHNVEARLHGAPGAQLGWEGGIYNASSNAAEYVVNAARGLASLVSFVAPRRPDPGPQQLFPTRALLPDARNLMQVISYLIMNERMTTFATLEDFMRDAFPQIASIGAPVADQAIGGGPAQGELHIYYVGREAEPIPLRLCGTGIEQTLALATGVLTAESDRLFLIDEPQAYLHPDAERSLLALLSENPRHQYVIATHSGFILNARPLSNARLLTMDAGATRIMEVESEEHILGALGITAADLWLAEAILWVEGASEAAVVAAVVEAYWPDTPHNLRVKAIPDASRFSSRSARQADAAYRFCESVATAVAPLEIDMRFLFDSDEKSDELKQQIEAASGGAAVFLPRRELENLFLDDPFAIHAVLADICTRVEREPPEAEAVAQFIEESLANTHDSRFFPSEVVIEDARRQAVGSHVLEQIWWDYASASYDKVEDGRAIARTILDRGSGALQPLVDVIVDLIGAPPTGSSG